MKSIEIAIANFLEKNSLTKEDIQVTEFEDNPNKVIIRVPSGNVQMLRKAEDTIYFGNLSAGGKYDNFIFMCVTRTSGILTSTPVLH